MTNYRMTWCENMLKILVISTLIIKNFSVSLLYKNRTKFTLLVEEVTQSDSSGVSHKWEKVFARGNLLAYQDFFAAL